MVKSTQVRRNLCGQVLHDLGLQIATGKVQPGDSIPQESLLCEQMGVSRTVIREAIKSLAAKGLVESRAKRGTIVRPSNDWNHLDAEVIHWQAVSDQSGQSLLQLTEFRQTMEPAAAAMAAERASEEQLQQIVAAFNDMKESAPTDPEAFLAADIQFHTAILHATGNRYFAPVANAISASLEASIRVTNSKSADNVSSIPAHQLVMQAICDRNPTLARETMTSMLSDAQQRIEKAVALIESQHLINGASDSES